MVSVGKKVKCWRARQIGGQEVKGCSYKALLEAVSPSVSELDQILFPTERWRPGCEAASRFRLWGLALLGV